MFVTVRLFRDLGGDRRLGRCGSFGSKISYVAVSSLCQFSVVCPDRRLRLIQMQPPPY
jgi:hypothetical protein